ncbi:ankyrin repeat domain-containing protein [Candidatus Finniella inopinata]|uniref:Ankyrin repeat domain-containing protein n=1 Tax=Candidatus Finniella inopinata TaxID=1696036 RepID=A0A4Q7DJ76_9PROT|nr:ankyrin repeat domain-containing protein [Candidatus Finniella inopinata]RZI46289.1 ankyrin repeat domain-containing protein [Candidatus Finniella inopinata]
MQSPCMTCTISPDGQVLYFMAGGGTANPTPLTLQRIWLPAYDETASDFINDGDLRQAVADRKLDSVKKLLSAGANPSAFDSTGSNALHVLASQYQQCFPNRGSTPKPWMNWLDMWGAMVGRISLGHKPAPQQMLAFFLHPNQYGDTVLHTAARNAAWEMLSWAIDLCKTAGLSPMIKRIPGAGGNTILHTIMANNDFDKSVDGSWTLGFVQEYCKRFYGDAAMVPVGSIPTTGFPDMFAITNYEGWPPLAVSMKDREKQHARLYYNTVVLEAKLSPDPTLDGSGEQTQAAYFDNAVSYIPTDDVLRTTGGVFSSFSELKTHSKK